ARLMGDDLKKACEGGSLTRQDVVKAHRSQKNRIRDAGRARELGAPLAALRGRVPGSREGALDHVQRELSRLQTQG
ncbi:hypothetical protein AB0L31_41660, partial [Streptomyces sp. NPDC052535]